MKLYLCLLLASLTAVGCAGGNDQNNAASFTEPWAYCHAVGTIDQPDSRYTGPANTPEMVKKYASAAGLPKSSPLWKGEQGPSLAWRCADGQLLICSYGANIPCLSKANTSRDPTEAMNKYCANPPPSASPPGSDQVLIPAFIAGHDTVYAWECKDGAPEITGQPAEVDAQGYIARFWYHVLPVN